MAEKMIRVLVVPVGKPPEIAQVPAASWKTWYRLLDPTTNTFECLPLLPGIDLLFDEEGRYKDLPVNVRVAARARPAPDPDTFMIDMTNGKGMLPGEPGIGYHEILGPFLIARTADGDYVDLRDGDIATFQGMLQRGT